MASNVDHSHGFHYFAQSPRNTTTKIYYFFFFTLYAKFELVAVVVRLISVHRVRSHVCHCNGGGDGAPWSFLFSARSSLHIRTHFGTRTKTKVWILCSIRFNGKIATTTTRIHTHAHQNRRKKNQVRELLNQRSEKEKIMKIRCVFGKRWLKEAHTRTSHTEIRIWPSQ